MRPTSLRAGFAVATLLLAGCGGRPAGEAAVKVDTLHPGLIQVTSPTPTGWTDSSRGWRYRATLTIQPPDNSPGELGQPFGVALDDWGRIYAWENNPPAIKVFDSTGAFLRTIGRRGGGPGEFEVVLLAVRGANVVVQDPQQSRLSVFDTSGKFIRSWPSNCCYWDAIGIDSAGLISIPIQYQPDSGQADRGSAFRRFRLDSTSVDTVFVPGRPGAEKTWTFSSHKGGNTSRMMFPVPFAPRLVRTHHPDGGFVVGWSGEYRILRSPRGEDTTLIAVRAWTPDRVPDEMREERTERTVNSAKGMVGEATARQVAKLSDVPVDAPAFTSLGVDPDGNIYARRFAGADSAETRFDVFAPSGSWLGMVTLPLPSSEYRSPTFARGAIYAVTEDDEGRPAIVRFTRTQ